MDCIQTSYNAPDVTSAFQYLYKSGSHRYTDFVFISQDGKDEYRVHKLVVSLFSPVLSSFVENNNSYQVDFINSKALQNMVRFFYDQDPIINDFHDVRSTKTIADKFEIVQLAEICRERFSHLPVILNDVLAILETSRELKHNAKERECIELIGRNRDILKSEQFKNLQYQTAIDILEKIKDMHLITEANFLEYAIKWLEANGMMVEKKSDLKEKINVSDILLDDFLSLVVSFPEFFSNVEISQTVKEIWSKQVEVQCESKIANNSDQAKYCTASAGRNASNSKQLGKAATSTQTNDSKSFSNVGTSIEKSLLTHCTKEVGTDLEKSLLINVSNEVGTNTDVLCSISTAVNTEVQGSLPAVQQDQEPEKQKLLIVQVLNEEDGVNIYKISKRVKFTIRDGISTRSLQVKFDDVLRKGLLGKVLEKRQYYEVSDVNVSYEGIFNMMRMIKDDDDDDLKPTELIEVLKAIDHFELGGALRDKCVTKISKIVDNDPLFLDGLRTFSFFEDQCLAILLQEPFNVILHPNFIHCSAGLIHLLLKQSELKVKSESQLLLVVISWLEASVKEKRNQFRSLLLKNLAFESISTKDFKYAVSCHPNFFDKEEKEVILAYRNAIGKEERNFREKLPPWYTFKSRTLI